MPSKACTCCGKRFLADEFPSKGRKADGTQLRKSHCNKCDYLKKKQRKDGFAPPVEETKECRACKQLLPHSSFHANGGKRRDGSAILKPDCKACYAAARESIVIPLDLRRLAAALERIDMASLLDAAVARYFEKQLSQSKGNHE